jgi:glycerate-2-kinase
MELTRLRNDALDIFKAGLEAADPVRAVRKHLQRKEILASGHPVSRPACIISEGETTITIKGKGLGGRNQAITF